jgi:hypothetical protein
MSLKGRKPKEVVKFGKRVYNLKELEKTYVVAFEAPASDENANNDMFTSYEEAIAFAVDFGAKHALDLSSTPPPPPLMLTVWYKGVVKRIETLCTLITRVPLCKLDKLGFPDDMVPLKANYRPCKSGGPVWALTDSEEWSDLLVTMHTIKQHKETARHMLPKDLKREPAVFMLLKDFERYAHVNSNTI